MNYPSQDVLFDALDRLMIAAGQHQWSVVCPFLLDQITNTLKKLRYDVVSSWINNFLSRHPTHDVKTISTVCHVLEGKPHEFENIKWLNQSSCSMLQSFLSLDSETNGFAVDRLLVKVAFSNHRLLTVSQNTFKHFLITNEIELNSIPATLSSLIIVLYGGLKRDEQSIVFDPAYIHRESPAMTTLLIRFLSIKDPMKQEQGLKN